MAAQKEAIRQKGRQRIASPQVRRDAKRDLRRLRRRTERVLLDETPPRLTYGWVDRFC